MPLHHFQNLNFLNKTVFCRLDLNVPLKNGVISDDTRIRAALPTVKALMAAGAKVVVGSHLGRPDGYEDPAFGLEPVGALLAELLGCEVILASHYVEEPIDLMLLGLKHNQIILLENLRFYPGETKGDSDFASALLRGIDLYVSDAFGVLHRPHASVSVMPEKLGLEKSAAGFLVAKEVEALGRVREHPESPFVLVIGGAKVSDKIEVILPLLEKCNDLVIGGAMAYSFLAHQGIRVGLSRVESDKLHLAESILSTAAKRGVRVHLPIDHLGAAAFDQKAEPVLVGTKEIPGHLMGLDIGPKTIEAFTKVFIGAKTIFWNGPMGVFEWPAFAKGTLSLAKAMAAASAYTVVGGGDSVSAAHAAGVYDDFDHVSTGGGASLEYLEGKTLPGLKVLMSEGS